jgi:hypothetical protein
MKIKGQDNRFQRVVSLQGKFQFVVIVDITFPGTAEVEDFTDKDWIQGKDRVGIAQDQYFRVFGNSCPVRILYADVQVSQVQGYP